MDDSAVGGEHADQLGGQGEVGPRKGVVRADHEHAFAILSGDGGDQQKQ
jgi:hypothetical protein